MIPECARTVMGKCDLCIDVSGRGWKAGWNAEAEQARRE